jgi:hypothetical protein
MRPVKDDPRARSVAPDSNKKCRPSLRLPGPPLTEEFVEPFSRATRISLRASVEPMQRWMPGPTPRTSARASHAFTSQSVVLTPGTTRLML